MNLSKIAMGCALAVGIAACGGSAPPAQTGGASDPALENKPPSGGGSTAAPPAGSANVAEGPTSPDFNAGVRAVDAGNYAEARKAFEASSKKDPHDFQSLYNLGMVCEKLGDPAAAETAYKAALAAKPELDSAAIALSSLYIEAGRNDDALTVAKNGLAKRPGSGPLHENLGVALAARGDQDNATKEFTQALQITPTDPMFHLTFAHWLNVWKVRGAAPHLDVARDAVKDDYGMIVSIGHEYRMAAEFDSCVKTFDRAVTMKDGGEARTERALCRLGLKDAKGTLSDLQAAVEKEPTYAPAHYYLGGRLAMTGHFKEAAAEYSKVIDLAPNGSLAKPASERLKAAQDAMKQKK
jgi:tetratricopeptide (TPR) repeat protein